MQVEELEDLLKNCRKAGVREVEFNWRIVTDSLEDRISKDGIRIYPVNFTLIRTRKNGDYIGNFQVISVQYDFASGKTIIEVKPSQEKPCSGCPRLERT